MPRYFLEVSYKGSRYSGSQIQDNAVSVQEELEKAFGIYFRKKVEMTGSSRTDTGVHALQNFFHFDWEGEILETSLYNINSILPDDIVVKALYATEPGNHCRFDAIGREYHYIIYQAKDPFLQDRAYYFPYAINLDSLKEAAHLLTKYQDFRAFSKRNAQAKTSLCTISRCEWVLDEKALILQVEANRFLRGMVRGLVGTMLQVGRARISVAGFETIIRQKDSSKADFSVPGHGLFLVRVQYPEGMLKRVGARWEGFE
jgi:tRNA pseudouridine38-40 synthase